MRTGDVGRNAVPPTPSLADLIATPEGQWFERKSGRVQPKDLAKPMVALANAEGGVIIVGLEDGRVVPPTAAARNAIRQVAMDHTRPVVRAEVTELQTPEHPDPLVIIRVAPGDHVHESAAGEAYLRVGDESRRLSFAQRQELEYDRGPQTYDGTPSGTTTTELDPQLTDSYREAIGSSSIDSMLGARGLLTVRGEVTVAAHLLFHAHPHEYFPNAYVRVLRYTATERGTGSSLNLDDAGDIRCEGSLPTQIRLAAEAVERLLPTRRALGSAGRFEGVPMLPRDAWLEGLVNAVVHRSYSIAGDHIRFEIFPDRVEITSPGRFPGLADPTRPTDIQRYARNPRIARVLSDLRITQELGEGIRRIYAEMRRVGLTDPIYSQTSAQVRLVLAAAHAIPEHILNDLPRSARRVLDALLQAGRALGTGEVTDLTGLARPTTIRSLQALRKAGLVVWEGNSSKDPRATWRVA